MFVKDIGTETRKMIYRREGYRCALCDDTQYLQIHHYIHRSCGGTNHPHNLICLCYRCHSMVHGTIFYDGQPSVEDMEQAMVEYLEDYYMEVWNPYNKPP